MGLSLYSYASLMVILATAQPTGDPVVAEVNLHKIQRSELVSRMSKDPSQSVSGVLRALVIEKLLLQEADTLKAQIALPENPTLRARAFLNKVASKRIICGNIAERNLRQMYNVMKPRFVHGDLYHLAELAWNCKSGQSPESANCIDQAWTYADHYWQPIAGDAELPSDLFWLGELSETSATLKYVEFTVHVSTEGKANVRRQLVDAIKGLSSGQATVLHDKRGARIVLLMSHRPPTNYGLDSPHVRQQVRDELCPRLVKQHRERYVSDLLKTARVTIFKEHLPDPKTPE